MLQYGVFLHNHISIKRYFSVRRRDIAYLRFIIESYEGLATLSTVDGKVGIVSLAVPGCFVEEMDRLVLALENEIAIKEIMFFPGNVDPVEQHGTREHKIDA